MPSKIKTREKREAALARQGGLCHFCKQSAEPHEIDTHHNQPRSHGGRDTMDNIRAGHIRCHRAFHSGRAVGNRMRPTPRTIGKLRHAGFVDTGTPLWWRDTNGIVMGWLEAIKSATAYGTWISNRDWDELRENKDAERFRAGTHKLGEAWNT